MERKAFVNIAAAVTAAAVSAVILYEMLIAGSLLQEAGLAGVFLASMFSHLTIVGRDMFVPTFLALAPRYHPLLLGLAAGLGGAIGEVSTYYWGLGIKDALKGAEKDDTLPKWVEKYGLLAVLIVSATPLPDTPIVLLAGSARLPLRKLLVVEASGKTLWYSFGALVGGFFFMQLSAFMDEILLSTIIVVASFVLCVVFSWSKSREKVLKILRRVLH